MSLEISVEYVDLVDASGQIQILHIPRSQIDQYPNFHLPIIVAVINNKHGEILVQQRALHKKAEPGAIDYICGAILAGESPTTAVIRESIEETGLTPTNLKLIDQSVNLYNRYRYLFIGQTEGQPISNPTETEWARFMYPTKLQTKNQTGQMTFVKDFFSDLDIALATIKR